MENEANFMPEENLESNGCSKLDTATTVYCVTGATVAIVGAVAKWGKKGVAKIKDVIQKGKDKRAEKKAEDKED